MRKTINTLLVIIIVLICILLVSCKNPKYKLCTGNINGNYYSYWNSVKPIINYVYSAIYSNHTVVVKFRIIDGVIRLVDAYVETR